MKTLEEIIKSKLQTLKESNQEFVDEKRDGKENYMFFGNIKQMKRQCELLMAEDHEMIDNILKEHDWAQDHIAEAKSLLDQVFDFLMNETKESDYLNEEYQIDESKNKPTNPKLWAASLAWAKSRYKVCPSAYCNGAAAKRYKSKGGKWKKIK
jgi:hypothetical protein